jgi:hypothetical protein
MELDVLKTIWKEETLSNTATTQAELEEMLSRKSKNPITKMKRNLFWELVVVVVIYSATILHYFFTYKGGMLSLAWTLVVLGALYVAYYVRKRKLLNSMECVTCEVRSNLSTQLTTLEKFIKLYMWVGTILFPVVMMISFIIVYLYDPVIINDPNKNSPLFFWLYFGITLLFSAVLTIPVYFINKWYVHKLYGQHAKKLRSVLNEMNEMPFGEENTL